jgi:hypothetical protein
MRSPATSPLAEKPTQHRLDDPDFLVGGSNMFGPRAT